MKKSFHSYSGKFYMNVVGYKGIFVVLHQLDSVVFYMNVVGYKVPPLISTQSSTFLVLYERSGI